MPDLPNQDTQTPTAPVAAPAAPPTIDPLPGTRTTKPFALDDDPNHQMQRLIAKRKDKKTDEPQNQTQNSKRTDKPEPETPPATDKKDELGEDVGSVIAKALKFRQKASKKQDDQPKEPAKEPDTDPASKKTIVKKAQRTVAPDAARVAAEAAAAATKEALAAVLPSRAADKTAEKPEDHLHSEDRKEYEVAKFLAERDPKYKDAPSIILSHVKQVEQYIKRWEQLNPGKAFEKDDEEHDDFYNKIQKPWTDDEYEAAKEDMAVERVLARRKAAEEPELQKLKAENAKLAIRDSVEGTYKAVAGLLAKSVLPKTEFKEGWFDKLTESDPIASEALAQTITDLRPFIETAVQIDDPEGRFPFDKTNEHHQAWLEFLTDKEAQFDGVEHDGRMFATRREYAGMTKAQRAKHWYLDVNSLVTEMVKDTAEAVTKSIDAEKKRQEKIALAMGYVPKAASNGAPSAPPPTQSRLGPSPPTPNANPPKPDSPSAGSGAKIDQAGGGNDRGMNGLLSATGKILFNR